jgi:hypothetical protein
MKAVKEKGRGSASFIQATGMRPQWEKLNKIVPQ